MCRAREVVGVSTEEWAPMLSIQVHRQVTDDDIRRWEVGLGPCPPGDILMAAAYLADTPIHELLGSAEHVRKLVDLEAKTEVNAAWLLVLEGRLEPRNPSL